jgi:hypothetical protein
MPSPDATAQALSIAGNDERSLPDARRPLARRAGGNQHANKHGRYSAEADARRRAISALIRGARELDQECL